MKMEKGKKLLIIVSLILSACTTPNKSFHESDNRVPSADAGPFPIEKTSVDHMAYDFNRKIELKSGQMAAELASGSPDGTITLKDSVNAVRSKIDPITQLPVLNPDGTPVMETINYPAGTILNPSLNPADNILIPKGVTVTNKAMADGPQFIGRFAYYGNVPRFSSDNLEMTASKMAHTLRVKAWVTNSLVKDYEFRLLRRFKGIYDAFSQKTMHFVPLKSLKKLATNEVNSNRKKLYKVASFYEQTLLEKSGLDIYNNKLDDLTYKNTVLTGIVRSLLNNNALTIQDALDLYNKYKTDLTFAATRESIANELFKFHLGSRYAVVAADPTQPDRIGYLTFVYPIAIDKDGPFKLPSSGLRKFPLSVSMEARWWSDRWMAEFGGFPFLQITNDGVAFHGPITFSDSTDVWYLRRDNVSHSCMRMDASDLEELRALIPADMTKLESQGKTIPLVIQEWPDVTDIDNNGTLEVVDVAYYKMPTSPGEVNNPENWKPTAMNKSWWTTMFSPYVNKLPSKNTFKVISTSITDPVTKSVTRTNSGVFTGLPQYQIQKGGQIGISSYYQETPIKTMEQRPTAIIQYREDNINYKDPRDMNDNMGKFPPKYFNTL